MPNPVIRKRLVFHFAGYDPMPPESYHRRFVRELDRFRTTWTADATASPSEPALGGDAIAWRVAASGPNWRVDTEHLLSRWNDVAAEASRRPDRERLPRALAAFASFVFGGALWGYLRTSWRYAGFFLYPYVLLAVFALVSLAAAGLIARLAWPGAWMIGVAAGLGLFLALLRWAAPRLFLPLMLDDWTFAHAYIRGEEAQLEERVERTARALVAATRGDADEILILGHSLGAVLAIDMLERALRQDPDLGRRGPTVGLATVGSSVLKIGLHRGATRFRAAVAHVAAEPSLVWADYQALRDIMNFYRTDPIAAMRLPPTGKPILRPVSLRKMLNPSAFRRMRHRLFRLHCQFVSGNDRRAPYDYFMLMLGPVPFERQALTPEGAAPSIAADGALIGADNVGAETAAPMPLARAAS
ncbi:MAG TPA: hypothetical protein VKA90_06445 [Beijerinckiaceae bacterium]|nr:hypothetical protein [Beijerinckiaceae bacterium]